MAALAIMTDSSFSPTILTDYNYMTHEDCESDDAPQREIGTPYDSSLRYTIEQADRDAALATRSEPTWFVEALLSVAFGSPLEVYARAENTIASFKGRVTQRQKDYMARFAAVVRVALETEHPARFSAFLNGVVDSEMKEIIGAALKANLRPAHLVYKVNKRTN